MKTDKAHHCFSKPIMYKTFVPTKKLMDSCITYAETVITLSLQFSCHEELINGTFLWPEHYFMILMNKDLCSSQMCSRHQIEMIWADLCSWYILQLYLKCALLKTAFWKFSSLYVCLCIYIKVKWSRYRPGVAQRMSRGMAPIQYLYVICLTLLIFDLIVPIMLCEEFIYEVLFTTVNSNLHPNILQTALFLYTTSLCCLPVPWFVL